MAALRDNAGKPELSYLLDLPRAMTALAKVFEQGAIKYARGNWKLGGKPNEEYIDSALRHLFALATEAHDPDTGCMHAAHVMWNMAALIELNYIGPPLDPFFDQAGFEKKYAKPVIPAAEPTYIAKQGPGYIYTDNQGRVWTDAGIDQAATKAVQAGARARNTVDL